MFTCNSIYLAKACHATGHYQSNVIVIRQTGIQNDSQVLSKVVGVMSFPNEVRRKSSTLLTIALLPKIINVVVLLAGFIRS